MRLSIIVVLLLVFGIVFAQRQSVLQESSIPQGGCVVLDKTKPPLFISYERNEKAWVEHKYEGGVLLRLTNNSSCVVSLTVAPGEIGEIPPNFAIRGGKWVRLTDKRIGSIKSGKQVDLYYRTEYPEKAAWFVDGDFHVIDHIYLNNGDHIFFTVPLTNFRKRGRVLVPFQYDWDSGRDDAIAPRFVEHFLVFDADRLPAEALK